MRKRNNGDRIVVKLVWLYLAVILALVALALRITYINATSGSQYSRTVLSQAQQRYTSRTIPYRRGDILDRNGEILATSEKVYNVILDCKVVNDTIEGADGVKKKRYYEPTIKALHDVLGISESTVKKLLDSDETKDSQYQIILKDVSITKKQAFEDYTDTTSDSYQDLSADEKAERANVKGVWFEDNYRRVYPHNSLACDTIGFTYSSDNQADWGIEGYYEDVLNGINGRQYGYFSTDDDVEQTIVPAQDGKNVVSTLDVNVQQIIRTAIENFNSKYSDGDTQKKGAENIGVVVMDPDTGEILGMDSSDWYDLNNPRDLTPFYTDEEIKAMDNDQMLEALNGIWRNYCVSDAFEPGSTFKPITAAAALETGVISPTDTLVCDGGETFSGVKVRCESTHGQLTLQEALKYSCNDFMMQLAEKLGSETLLKYQKMFGFGSRTGIDLPGEGTGVIFSQDAMGAIENATTSFGQGFTTTMIQEAAAFCAAINGGTYYQPHVLSQITDENGSVVSTYDTTVRQQILSQSVSDEIRSDLITAVQSGGSGQKAKVEGYSMGGKTGTAQKLPRGNGKYLVSFAGFAPADDPQVVVYVIVDEPHTEPQANNAYATGIAKEIFTNLLPYINIFPDEGTTASSSGTNTSNGNAAISDAGSFEPESGGNSTAIGADGDTGSGTADGTTVFSEGITNEEQQALTG
jgi:stage V sporulation protein D (sporulation-specific penicillin-binding protein)